MWRKVDKRRQAKKRGIEKRMWERTGERKKRVTEKKGKGEGEE